MQLGIYLPSEQHVAHGLVRVMLLDAEGDAGGTAANFMDSDGAINDDTARNLTEPAHGEPVQQGGGVCRAV